MPRYFLSLFLGYLLICFGIGSILLGAEFVPAFFSGCGLGVFIGFWYSFVLFISGLIKIQLGFDFLKRKFNYLIAAFVVAGIFDGIVWYYFFYISYFSFLNSQIKAIFLFFCYCLPLCYLILNKKRNS